MAPEILATHNKRMQGYDKSVDWWAIGILTYELMVGATPFFHNNRSNLEKKI